MKAYRARHLGMRIMVDFHYSDQWADPGQQNKPAAWLPLSFDELKIAVAEHTITVLRSLKDKGITPEWVQVGNETGNGMSSACRSIRIKITGRTARSGAWIISRIWLIDTIVKL